MVCFPRFKAGADLDTGAFHRLLLDDYKTMVGPGHWFDMDDRYLRIGFGYPTRTAMRQGLLNIDKAARRAARTESPAATNGRSTVSEPRRSA